MPDELWAGRYRRHHLLGRGAMGEVWAAFDVVLDRPVAIKSIAETRTDPDDLERMSREARVAARLSHSNAVAVYDLVTHNGRPNLVMEHVDGDTLADRIATYGRLPPAQVTAIGAAVADALAEAHRLGIVHRDIKPANILITPRGVPKLADFGIARVSGDAGMTATGMMIGTPAYMAPEVVQGGPANPRSDVWSLGVTLYAALEGAPPFVHAPEEEPFVVLGRVITMPIRPPSCGGALGSLVLAMLDRDPHSRPSAEQAARQLRAGPPTREPTTTRAPQFAPRHPPVAPRHPPVAPRHPPVAPPRTADPPLRTDPIVPGVWSTGPVTERRSRRGWTLAAVAVVILLVAGTITGVLLTRPHSSQGAGPAPAATTGGPTRTTTVTATATGDSPAPSDTSSTGGAPTPSAGQQSYTAAGGMSVVAPQGWNRDFSIGTSRVSNFVEPPETSHLVGTSFQIGIGNPDPTTIQGEARGAIKFLHSIDSDVQASVSYLTYQGVDAVDIDYTGVNGNGSARRGFERLWIADGVTREIIVNTPVEDYDASASLRQQLIATCRMG